MCINRFQSDLELFALSFQKEYQGFTIAVDEGMPALNMFIFLEYSTFC